MNIPFIDLKAQYEALRPQIQHGIHKVLEHGQYIMGPEVEELEVRLANFTGARHCITVASGTEALLISLMALGVGRGDEVVTSPFTFVATAEVIALLGATPVFVDVDPKTCNLDATLLADKLTRKTKAILPVSLYGQVADMAAIDEIAANHGGIPVIEDGAQSFGATYGSKKSCNLSTIGCTSFFPSKPLGCYGDGGAIFTDNEEIAQACREIRVHGQRERYVHTRVGVGGRLDTIQAAVLLAKLETFEWEIEERIRIGSAYNLAMDNIGISRVYQHEDRTSVFAQFTIFVHKRDQLRARLAESGIPTAVHYPLPLNRQAAYEHYCCPECTPNSSRLSRQVLSLPMSPFLADDAQQAIVEALAAAVSRA